MVRQILKSTALAVGLLLIILIVATVALGPRRIGRTIGAAWLLGIEYPAGFPLLQTYHAVVVSDSSTWVEFEHESHEIGIDETTELLDSAMTGAGYEKYTVADEEKGDMIEEGVRGFIYARANGRFCFKVSVAEGREFGSTVTRVRSIYQLFSPAALDAERDLAKLMREQDTLTTGTGD